MREIEFRGQTNSGRWIYGSLVYSESIQPAIYFEVGQGEVKTMDWAYVKPTSVGQFTGLYDKNGKRIYEGDILRVDFIENNVDVRYVDDCFMACDGNYPSGPLCAVYEECMVIGNIHDNPELIKQ